jgi:hypothetical protein
MVTWNNWVSLFVILGKVISLFFIEGERRWSERLNYVLLYWFSLKLIQVGNFIGLTFRRVDFNVLCSIIFRY